MQWGPEQHLQPFFLAIDLLMNRTFLKGKFSSGTKFQITFKPMANTVIFKSKYNFVILELIGQPCCDLEQNNNKNV